MHKKNFLKKSLVLGIIILFFGAGVEIVEKLGRNKGNPQMLFYQILEKFPILARMISLLK